MKINTRLYINVDGFILTITRWYRGNSYRLKTIEERSRVRVLLKKVFKIAYDKDIENINKEMTLPRYYRVIFDVDNQKYIITNHNHCYLPYELCKNIESKLDNIGLNAITETIRHTNLNNKIRKSIKPQQDKKIQDDVKRLIVKENKSKLKDGLILVKSKKFKEYEQVKLDLFSMVS